MIPEMFFMVDDRSATPRANKVPDELDWTPWPWKYTITPRSSPRQSDAALFAVPNSTSRRRTLFDGVPPTTPADENTTHMRAAPEILL